MIHLEDGSIVPVEKSELPIKLPEDIDLSQNGNPLEGITKNGNIHFIKRQANLQRGDRYFRYLCGLILVFLKILLA